MKNKSNTVEHGSQIGSAWVTLEPKKTFAGMTVQQFLNKIQPSIDIRKKLAELDSQRTALINRRNDADKATKAAIQLVVNAVKGDPATGEDSDLYDAMGYVRRSERTRGPKRSRKVLPIEKAA